MVLLTSTSKTTSSPPTLTSLLSASTSPPTSTTTSSTTVCIAGTGPGNYVGLCNFCCIYGYCPPGPCTCTASGAPVPTPPTTGVNGSPLPEEEASYLGLCSFACNHGYCPNTTCQASWRAFNMCREEDSYSRAWVYTVNLFLVWFETPNSRFQIPLRWRALEHWIISATYFLLIFLILYNICCMAMANELFPYFTYKEHMITRPAYSIFITLLKKPIYHI